MANTNSATSEYVLDYHDSVTRSHTSRTATKEAAFLLPHLKPHYHILDVGCGPGSITSSFLPFVPQGSATGVDISETVIAQAKSLAFSTSSASPPPTNLHFQTANVTTGLPFPDAAFDVVFSHQVLSNLADPATAMREMRRVCRGLIASREGNAEAFSWLPDPSGLLRLWVRGMCESVRAIGVDSTGGQNLHVWARRAGFDPLKMRNSLSAVIYSTPEERRFWAELHKERIERSALRERLLKVGIDEGQLESMGRAMLDWVDDVDGMFVFPSHELVAHV